MPSDNYNFHFKSDITNEGEFPTWARHNEKITYKNGFPTAEKETDGLATVDTTVCSIQFTIPDPIGPPVLFYYRLTNFYQNHRRYVKSLDTDQLSGKKVAKDTIAGGSCDPLKLNSDGSRPYYPCGLIANSVFNDTFASPRNLRKTGDTATYSMSNKGIAWDSDKKLYGKTQYNVSEIAVPLNWQRRYGPEGYTTSNGPPDLSQYEEFQVWMRTAGLPAFSKLALRNDKDEMEAGRYQVDINLSKYL